MKGKIISGNEDYIFINDKGEQYPPHHSNNYDILESIVGEDVEFDLILVCTSCGQNDCDNFQCRDHQDIYEAKLTATSKFNFVNVNGIEFKAVGVHSIYDTKPTILDLILNKH